jgi:hypothetical protein
MKGHLSVRPDELLAKREAQKHDQHGRARPLTAAVAVVRARPGRAVGNRPSRQRRSVPAVLLLVCRKQQPDDSERKHLLPEFEEPGRWTFLRQSPGLEESRFTLPAGHPAHGERDAQVVDERGLVRLPKE